MIVVQEDDVGLRNEIQKEGFLLLDIFQQNGLFPVQLHGLKDVNMVGPKTNFDSFERILDKQPHHISLLLKGAGVFVGDLILDIFDHSNNVHQVAIRPFTVMLPAIVLMLVLRLHCLILDLVNLVLLVLQANLRARLRFLAVEELKTSDQVASALFELFRLLYGRPACDVYAHQLAICIEEAEVEKRHRAVLCVLAAELHADQSSHEVSLLVVHNIHQSQRFILLLSSHRSRLIAFIMVL